MNDRWKDLLDSRSSFDETAAMRPISVVQENFAFAHNQTLRWRSRNDCFVPITAVPFRSAGTKADNN
jgi:hypothetical protein